VKRIEVFRTGTHRAMNGVEDTYTDTQLRLTAAAYDPAVYKAPVCIGHPTTDAPAWAWVQGLEFAGGILSAYVDDVEPAFAEAVRAGRYRNVSASFWRPDAPSNPKAGILSLRHVGFLGAVPPAVKGLATASFADAGEEVLDFPGSDAPLSDVEVERLEHAARETTRRRAGKAPSKRDADLATREAEIAAREAALARTEVANFCDKLERQGRLLPAMRAMAEALIVAAPEAETVTFAEGEDPIPVRTGLMRFLGMVPPMVTFGEVAPVDPREDAGAPKPFDLPRGYRVEPDRAVMLARAEHIMKAEGVSFAEAARRAEAGG